MSDIRVTSVEDTLDGESVSDVSLTSLDGGRGPAGPAGPTGPTGPTGATGPAGNDGADGATGATGPAGADGTDGVDGQDGAPGADGSAGATGATGPKGDQGDPGTDGVDGAGADWIDPRDYGCDPTGGTDCTSGMQSAIDAAANGTLYLGGAYYKTAGGLTVDDGPVHFLGSVSGNTDPGETPSERITSTSATNVFLTVNAQGCHFTNLCIQNTATTPTAGAGILIATGGYEAYDHLYISGFYTNIDHADGGSWTMTDSTVHDHRKYGMRIRNATSADWGDQSIQGCIFSTLHTGDAAIRYESGGGLKIGNTKINSGPSGHDSYGIDVAWGSGTSVIFMVANCSIEGVTAAGIRIVDTAGFEGVNIDNVEFGFWNGLSGRAIEITGVDNVTIGHITVPGNGGSGGSGALIGLTSCNRVTIGPVAYEGFTSTVSQSSCTAVVDLNASVPSTRTVSAGTGLSGGGDLTADRSLAIDTSAEAERIRDVIGTALVGGTNVTVTVDDSGDTITVAATGGSSYTDEQVRDVIGAALVAGTGVTISVNDAADTITITASGGGGGGSVATDTIFDAKGDLAVGTGADTAAKLTVGANDSVLVADSTQTTGLKYAGAWTSYTPTWAATSGTPSVGTTGSLTGAYQQLGKTVNFRLNLVFGGTGISGGTGSWNFALPPVAHIAPPSGIGQHGILLGGYFEDLGAVAYGVLGGRLKASSTTAFEVFYASHSASFPGSGSTMGATAPFTWGAGDYLSFYGTYQAA